MLATYLAAAPRLDWGFENPNKTAALIASLMIAVWALPALAGASRPRVREAGVWLALAACAGLGVPLLLTGSRGGVVAVLCGLGVLLAYAKRPWARRHVVGASLAAVALCVMSGVAGTAARMSPTYTAADASVGNRLIIWKNVPNMMADAPGGWGLGRSGDMFMAWYQPTDRFEEYRTLVSSHFTWLVEFGWAGRIAYVAAWALALCLAWPGGRLRIVQAGRRLVSRRRGGAVFVPDAGDPDSATDSQSAIRNPQFLVRSALPLALLVAFGVAAAFSSVAEAWPLWIPPALGLAWAVVERGLRRAWPGRRELAWAVAMPPALLALLVLPFSGRSGVRCRDAGNTVTLGDGEPAVVIVAGAGAKESPKRLRSVREESGLPGAVVWTRAATAPSGLPSGVPVAVLGRPKAEMLRPLVTQAEKVVALAPPYAPGDLFTPEELPKVSAFYGEFSASPHAYAWRSSGRCESLPAMADFIADWPERVLAVAKRPKAN